MNQETKFQIGKAGLTPGVLQSLRLALTNRKSARISVLKSLNRNKEKVKQIAEEITNNLGAKSSYRIIGFTIILKRKSRFKDDAITD